MILKETHIINASNYKGELENNQIILKNQDIGIVLLDYLSLFY